MIQNYVTENSRCRHPVRISIEIHEVASGMKHDDRRTDSTFWVCFKFVNFTFNWLVLLSRIRWFPKTEVSRTFPHFFPLVQRAEGDCGMKSPTGKSASHVQLTEHAHMFRSMYTEHLSFLFFISMLLQTHLWTICAERRLQIGCCSLGYREVRDLSWWFIAFIDNDFDLLQIQILQLYKL
jgi:hypothetical protein